MMRIIGYLIDLYMVPARVKEILVKMDNITTLLNDVAEKLRGPVYTSVQALIARNAELEGTESTQSAAAANVQSAFGEVSDLFAAAGPETPDVPPLTLPDSDEDVEDSDNF
jgi:hypothetical protein